MGSKISRGEATSRERQKSVNDRSQSDYLLQHLLQQNHHHALICSTRVQSAQEIRLVPWHLTRAFKKLKRAWSKSPVYHHHTASFIPCGYNYLSLVSFVSVLYRIRHNNYTCLLYFCLVISNTESHLFFSATIRYSLKKMKSLYLQLHARQYQIVWLNTVPAGRDYLMWLPPAVMSN